MLAIDEHVEFPDNEPQLRLLDGRDLSIFAKLDDECSIPKGSERGFVDKLHDSFANEQHLCYDRPKRSKAGLVGQRYHDLSFPSHGTESDELSFIVVHYAESVCCECRCSSHTVSFPVLEPERKLASAC